MAIERIEVESPKAWEIMGGFFGYFAVAKDIPDVLRALGLTTVTPVCIRSWLLGLNPNPNLWLLWFFTVVTLVLLFWFLPNKKGIEGANEDRIERAVQVLKRGRLLRILRSLGLILAREKILDWMGVGFYGTFQRGSNWPEEPLRFTWVDRIIFKGGCGIEFQYSRGYCTIFVRTHPSGNDNYGPSEERKPTFGEVTLLVFASNFFIFWLAVHSIKRLFCLCTKHLREVV